MVKWDSDKNLFLVLKTLESHCPKLTPNAGAIIDGWPSEFGEKPTRRAIQEQWPKVRALSRKGKGSNASSTNGVNPTKGNAPISAARVKKEVKDKIIKLEGSENEMPPTDLPVGDGNASDSDEVLLPSIRSLLQTPKKPVLPTDIGLCTPDSSNKRCKQTMVRPTGGRVPRPKGMQRHHFDDDEDMEMTEEDNESEGGAALVSRTIPTRGRRVATYKEEEFEAEDESDISEYKAGN